MKAATSVFARIGFEHATMDDVCREARMSKGGMYRHVRSKDELFLRVAIDGYRVLSSDIRALGELGSSCSGYEELRAYVRVLLDFARAHVEGMRVLLQGQDIERTLDPASPSLAEYRQARDELRGLVVHALNRGRVDRSIRDDISPEHMATIQRGALRALLDMEMGVVRAEASVPEGAPGTDFVDLIMQMLRPPAAQTVAG